MSEPTYVKLHKKGELRQRIVDALDALESCHLCPRECGVNRLAGRQGYCKTGRKPKVASANAHFGEERPLVGRYGSGTIFISSCNLLCTFCQSADISHYNEGTAVGPGQLAAMMLALADRGCHNINFVSPSHVVPQILEALPYAVDHGLRVPLVFNTGGYDRVSALQLLDGIFDIYMPDFKFWEERWSDVFCRAPDYREVAKEAFREMHRQVGDLVMDESGIAVKGLLVRHLVMPNGVAGTGEIMRFLAEEISTNTYVNVMAQFWPCHIADTDPKIGRRITPTEYQQAVEAARNAGLRRLDKQI